MFIDGIARQPIEVLFETIYRDQINSRNGTAWHSHTHTNININRRPIPRQHGFFFFPILCGFSRSKMVSICCVLALPVVVSFFLFNFGIRRRYFVNFFSLPQHCRCRCPCKFPCNIRGAQNKSLYIFCDFAIIQCARVFDGDSEKKILCCSFVPLILHNFLLTEYQTVIIFKLWKWKKK